MLTIAAWKYGSGETTLTRSISGTNTNAQEVKRCTPIAPESPLTRAMSRFGWAMTKGSPRSSAATPETA